jgi:hypothetical protein
MCLAYTPDSSRGLRLDPCLAFTTAHKFRWGVDAFFNHIRAVESQYESRCLEAVIDEDEQHSRQGYVVLRQCVSSNRKQMWQRTSRDYSLPRLMLRPPDILPFDYVDLCVQVRDDRLGLDIHHCDDDVDLQVLVETFQMRVLPSPLDSDATNNRVWSIDPTHDSISPATVQLTENKEAEGQFWFRQGRFLRPWHTGGGHELRRVYAHARPDRDSDPVLNKFYSYNPVPIVLKQWKLEVTTYSSQLNYGNRAFASVEPVLVPANEFIQAELRGFPDVSTSVVPHCLSQFVQTGNNKMEFNPCPVAGGGLNSTQLLDFQWFECPDRCTPEVCDGRFNSQCVSLNGKATCECLPGWEGAQCEIKKDPCQNVQCGKGEYCFSPDQATHVCSTLTPCLVGEYMLPSLGSSFDRMCRKCPPGKVQSIYDIQTAGQSACKSRDQAAREALEAVLGSNSADVSGGGAGGRRRLENTENMDEQELSKKIWEACKAQNRAFLPATEKRSAGCSEVVCEDEMVPVCDEQGFDCACVYRALPGGLQNDLEFGVMLMSSAVMGMLSAAVVVMLFEIQKTKMFLKTKVA